MDEVAAAAGDDDAAWAAVSVTSPQSQLVLQPAASAVASC